MSRLNELKKHNPQWTKNFIDYVDIILGDTKPKYTELFINLMKQYIKQDSKYNFDEWRAELIAEGYDKSIVDSFNDLELIYFSRVIQNMIPKHEFETYKQFIDLNERNFIENKDITSIKSFKQLNELVSLAEIKSWEKDSQSQIIVELDNPETGWLLVRPLTYEASKKYGSSTKWCTTEKYNSNYFYRYYKNILVYCINRKTGYKVAMNHIVYDNETSFWNATDQRVDSQLTDLDSECRLKLVELINKGITNYNLTPEEYRNLEESETKEEYPAIELFRPQVRMVENDLVFRGNGIGITTTGDNTITLNAPNGLIYNTESITLSLPQLEISDWVKQLSGEQQTPSTEE